MISLIFELAQKRSVSRVASLLEPFAGLSRITELQPALPQPKLEFREFRIDLGRLLIRRWIASVVFSAGLGVTTALEKRLPLASGSAETDRAM